MPAANIHIGCAGWSLPTAVQGDFPAEGTHLARYATRFKVVEINSSFYRPHRLDTYVRWAREAGPGCTFSVKVPKAVTHEQRLRDTEPLLDEFLAATQGLGSQLRCLLVQLPPSAVFDAAVANAFLTALRERHEVGIALEPRHVSWFCDEAQALLAGHRVARVAADPARHAGAEAPAGDAELAYFRLHGSPRVYYSAYDDDGLQQWATRIRAAARRARQVICIFDNTAGGQAVPNALALQALLKRPPK